ncbi:hypothetical protein [Leifsonia sp. P73]|uniref:hypothetical protein n=1 Tax=Leifsonia sp. P73 TaxID=3423959 RepID=UPI003DA5C431
MASDRPYDDTLAAMQFEMLTIDEEFAGQWVATMRDLVGKQLDHAEFTAERMAALHRWERRRGAAQARLRWKYDGSGTRKRNPELVERDVRAQIAKLRGRLEAARQNTADRRARLEAGTPERPVSPEPHARTNTRARVTPVRDPQGPRRDFDGLEPFLLRMVAECSGLDDLEHATDEEVLRACMVHSHIPETAAQEYVDILNGVDIANQTIRPTS